MSYGVYINKKMSDVRIMASLWYVILSRSIHFNFLRNFKNQDSIVIYFFFRSQLTYRFLEKGLFCRSLQ